ncbi:MAG: alpha/beta hydrolase [Goleter apudmare HA4340-LM2]|jgi:pimeloyl-ACP methyl ester carboxylesterase|nr:alpha/beta hydrolase [Goleter apudmare HA4340-LM2]
MTCIEVESGIAVFVQDWGSGKPIMFIHGFPFSHRIFEYQMVALAQQGYRAIGIDLRGFGQSDKPWNGNDYDTWVSDIRQVIEALDLRDVTLVGFSMGGAITAHYAATQNDARVTQLVLLGAAAPIAAPQPEDKNQIEGFIQAILTDPANFAHNFVQQAFYQPLSPELLRFLAEMGTAVSLRTLVRAQEELRDRNLVPEMSNIQIPTLICHGVHDKVVPIAAGEAQQQLIKDAQLMRFEESGHGLFYEEKDRLTQALLSFVS